MIRYRNLLPKTCATLLLFIFSLVGVSATHAQQVGSYVIVVEDTDIYSGSTKVEHLTRGMALKVRGSRPGGWLWVTRHANGWVPTKHVVLLPTALDYLAAEISQRPQHAPLYNDRAMVMFEIGRYADAVKNYSTAIDLAPGSVALRANRAVAYFELEDFENAIKDLDEVVRRLPDDAQSYIDRGWALYHAGKYKEALADYEQALKLNPDSLQAEINLAWLRATCPAEELRDGKAALKVAKRATETTERKDPFALATLAAAQAELGEFATAAELQTEAVELAPYTRKKLYKERLAFYSADQPYRVGAAVPEPKAEKVAEADKAEPAEGSEAAETIVSDKPEKKDKEKAKEDSSSESTVADTHADKKADKKANTQPDKEEKEAKEDSKQDKLEKKEAKQKKQDDEASKDEKKKAGTEKKSDEKNAEDTDQE